MIPIYICTVWKSKKPPPGPHESEARGGGLGDLARLSLALKGENPPQVALASEACGGGFGGFARVPYALIGQPPFPPPDTQVGGRVDAVGFALTETVIASSRFWVMLKPVMEKSASSPVPAPSETNSAIGVLLK